MCCKKVTIRCVALNARTNASMIPEVMFYTSLSRFEHYYRVIKSWLRVRVRLWFIPNCNNIQTKLLHVWTHTNKLTITAAWILKVHVISTGLIGNLENNTKFNWRKKELKGSFNIDKIYIVWNKSFLFYNKSMNHVFVSKQSS